MYTNLALNFNPYFTNWNFLVFNIYYIRTEPDDIEFLAIDESTVFQKVCGNQSMFADKSKQIHSMSCSRPNTRRNKNIIVSWVSTPRLYPFPKFLRYLIHCIKWTTTTTTTTTTITVLAIIVIPSICMRCVFKCLTVTGCSCRQAL